MKFPIMESLPFGKENAISSEELASMHRLPSTRRLQAEIAKERKKGAIILSTSTGGYYKPSDRQEVQEFVATLEKRAKNTLAVLKSAKRYLKQCEGQMSIEDFTV